VWGGLHGFYLVFGMATRSVRQRAGLWTGLARSSATASRPASALHLHARLFRHDFLPRARTSETSVHPDPFLRNWDFGSIKTEQFLLRQMPVAVASILFLELVQLLNGKMRLSSFVALPPWYLAGPCI